MPSRAHGPEPCASANFATRAHLPTTSRQPSEISTARGTASPLLSTIAGEGEHGEAQKNECHRHDHPDEEDVMCHANEDRRRGLMPLRLIHNPAIAAPASKATPRYAH
jgi:hypothetical protein